ncbi:MAG TPA: GTPase domain-containing protein [Candidatus Methylomirabilis sp.]|nr:GTPase domain-containing protein [Candidatus Methylomirabilis sp.]
MATTANPGAVTLSLISHTNAGKTTLARTLLRRDVGEILDQAHVTDRSERYTLIETADARLYLWDTPGLGNTVRLMGRLRRESSPIGWLLSQVWDRLADRPLWSSQQAILNARDEADAVLYLVNSAEDPDQAAYVAQELDLLTWIGCPVLVLLNQTGPALPMLAGEAGAEEARRLEALWRAHTAPWPIVRDVLPLDAFSRCWVQEGVLFARLEPLLPEAARPILQMCAAAWSERNRLVLRASVEKMAAYLVATATDREAFTPAERSPLPWISGLFPAATRQAMQRLRERLEARTRELVDALVVAHGLEGRSTVTLREQMESFAVVGDEWLTPGRGAIIGGALSGAVGGLAADVGLGGLTFGGGAVLGAILGALGGAGLAAGYRLAQGDRAPAVSWSGQFLSELCGDAVLRYLAVAHFGRGRGGYADIAMSPRWAGLVSAVLDGYRDELSLAWSLAASADAIDRARVDALVESTLDRGTTAVLARGYPDTAPWFDIDSARARWASAGQ